MDSPWDRYEDGIYRKPHLNEKAFSNTLKREANEYDNFHNLLIIESNITT